MTTDDIQLTTEQIDLIYQHSHSAWFCELDYDAARRKFLLELLDEFKDNDAALDKLHALIQQHETAILNMLRKDVRGYIKFWYRREDPMKKHPDARSWALTQHTNNSNAFLCRFTERMIDDGLDLTKDPELEKIAVRIIRSEIDRFIQDTAA